LQFAELESPEDSGEAAPGAPKGTQTSGSDSRLRSDLLFVPLLVILTFGGALYFEHRARIVSFFPPRWIVAAGIAFEGDEAAALDHDFLSPIGGEIAARPKAGTALALENGETFTWRDAGMDGPILPLILYNQNPLGRREHLIGYAYTTFKLESESEGLLELSSDDGAKFWLNGELVHRSLGPRTLVPGESPIPVRFRAGENSLMVKVAQLNGGWGFSVRVRADPGSRAGSEVWK